MPYGSATTLAYLVKHLTNAGTFDNTANSQVTLAAVTEFLANVSAEIDLILAGRGYTVPVTDTEALAFLNPLTNWGAAMFCELSQPSAGFRGTENADTRAGAFRTLFEKGKKHLTERGLMDLGAAQGTATTQGLFSGSTQDEDGNDKEALFKREMFDYPGTGLTASTVDEEE